MSQPAAPPSPQEIKRKLSVHSPAKQHSSALAASPSITGLVVPPAISGTESDSDSLVSPDILPSSGPSGGAHGALSSIAERPSGSGEDSDEEEEEEEGGWKPATTKAKNDMSMHDGVIKAGYLWKKGERRKTWKKRWFVLRPAHLAYYKSSAEYQLLRLLDLHSVHSCTKVALKRHDYTFGLVSSVRTYYLQAKDAQEVDQWMIAFEQAKQALLEQTTQTSSSTPIPIPPQIVPPSMVTPSSPSHPPRVQNLTSSDSEDGAPPVQRSYSSTSQSRPGIAASPTRAAFPDPSKVIVSGYLMKCGSKRRSWRKRWFVLNSERLVYSGSHMDTKPHRQFPFSEILDALEYDLNAHRKDTVSPPISSPPPSAGLSGDDGDDSNRTNTFKIVTTKRTLLLCAPSEEEEIKWLGALGALIARRTEAGVVPGKISYSASSHMQSTSGSSMTGLTAGQRTSAQASPEIPSANISLGSGNSASKTRSRGHSASGAAGHINRDP